MSCLLKPNQSANETFSLNIITMSSLEESLNYFHVACAPVTIILNSLVLYIAVRRIDTASRLNQVYVIGMTLADLTFGVTYLSTKLSMECFPRWMCRVYYVFIWASQLLSVTSLLLLNIDKFISLHYPLKYQQIVTKELVSTLAALSWCLSISYPSVAFLGPLSEFSSIYIMRNNISVATVTDCNVNLPMTYYLIMLVGFYLCPTLLSLCISFYIFWIAQYLSHSYLDGVSGSRFSKNRAKQRIVKRILFVFSSTTWTAVTYLPYRIVYCALMFCSLTCTDPACHQSCRPDAVVKMGYALWFLLPLGCVGNPIITVVTQRVYRVQLHRVFREVFVDKMGCSQKVCPCLYKTNKFARESNAQSLRCDEPTTLTLRLRGTSVKRQSLAAIFRLHSRDETNMKKQSIDRNLTDDLEGIHKETADL